MDTSDFKNGISILVDGQVQTIVEFQHVKPGKGPAFVRSKLKNARTGAVTEKTWRAGERMEQAILERVTAQYLYSTGDEYVFMDQEDFEQFTLNRDQIGNQVKYLKDGMEVLLIRHGSEILNVELPVAMELEVVETDPGLRGDTASGGSKPAKVETGAVVQVPLFINVGDRIKVDTRSDEYLERAKG